jgi:hypothetical protein
MVLQRYANPKIRAKRTGDVRQIFINKKKRKLCQITEMFISPTT